MLYRNIKHEAVYSLERQKRPAAIRQPGATQRNTTQYNAAQYDTYSARFLRPR